MSLAHAKARLSDLLNTVDSGQEVVMTRHGRPVALRVLRDADCFIPIPAS